MKTLKKILVMCMTLVVMVGVTGCVDSDKQDRLLQFINVDLSEAKELETEANDAYTKVKEDENSGDAVDTQDEDRISKANELIEDADSVYDKYEKERDRLMDEYEVEWKSE